MQPASNTQLSQWLRDQSRKIAQKWGWGQPPLSIALPTPHPPPARRPRAEASGPARSVSPVIRNGIQRITVIAQLQRHARCRAGLHQLAKKEPLIRQLVLGFSTG